MVTFQPSGRTVKMPEGSLIVEAADAAGLPLRKPCGGKGTCGKCRVRLGEGAPGPTDKELRLLGEAEVARGMRMACQARVRGRMFVEVPRDAAAESGNRILSSDGGVRTEPCPAVRRVPFELPPGGREHADSDLARLRGAVGPFQAPLEVLRTVPGSLRGSGWRGAALLLGDELLALEPADAGPVLGVAVDVGTTTLVATLLDLGSGRELAAESCVNPQVAFGDDVISRIQRARDERGGLEAMRRAVTEAINAMIAETAGRAGVQPERVCEISVAGNTTMQQILCGLDPSALGAIPFPAVFDEALSLPARDLGFLAHPRARLFVFGQPGSFVGGDTLAGMLAARLDRFSGPVLFIDIGTNGEVVLGHAGRLLATSTAAGPAFEGARISQGMRAAAGAIDRVDWTGDRLAVHVLGDGKAYGLCGTGLVDAVAMLLDQGLVDETGRLLDPDELPAGTPGDLRRRLASVNGQAAFAITPEVRLLQRDVRELQLASGAIRCGVSLLLKRAGLAPGDLEAVLLAGGFGNWLRPDRALRLGLFPPVPLERIRFIGNSSSMGAKLALLSTKERAYAEDLRRRTSHVDLSLDPDFQSEFAGAMLFPGR